MLSQNPEITMDVKICPGIILLSYRSSREYGKPRAAGKAARTLRKSGQTFSSYSSPLSVNNIWSY
jgi:hypothetical protein